MRATDNRLLQWILSLYIACFFMSCRSDRFYGMFRKPHPSKMETKIAELQKTIDYNTILQLAEEVYVLCQNFPQKVAVIDFGRDKRGVMYLVVEAKERRTDDPFLYSIGLSATLYTGSDPGIEGTVSDHLLNNRHLKAAEILEKSRLSYVNTIDFGVDGLRVSSNDLLATRNEKGVYAGAMASGDDAEKYSLLTHGNQLYITLMKMAKPGLKELVERQTNLKK